MAVCPRKYLIKDLIDKCTPLDVWLQGTITHITDSSTIIISDTFGCAKITNCETVDGLIDKKSLRKGTYCCIIGKAVKTTDIPEVEASKFIDLSSQPEMKVAWEMEVKEANLLLEGKFKPSM